MQHAVALPLQSLSYVVEGSDLAMEDPSICHGTLGISMAIGLGSEHDRHVRGALTRTAAVYPAAHPYSRLSMSVANLIERLI
jgi:hypothetical protein